ncbi:putative prefoldin subunit 4 [Frankliniella fusca]|uniref:Prefoldin subunit 4 n=1 Tax=Frankliniella fusca TaxID=407009 RepID=A0AAE1GRE3_9NEOP|nr:putative prefoldin subunit 4 [Frankliniella fusca]
MQSPAVPTSMMRYNGSAGTGNTTEPRRAHIGETRLGATIATGMTTVDSGQEAKGLLEAGDVDVSAQDCRLGSNIVHFKDVALKSEKHSIALQAHLVGKAVLHLVVGEQLPHQQGDSEQRGWRWDPQWDRDSEPQTAQPRCRSDHLVCGSILSVVSPLTCAEKRSQNFNYNRNPAASNFVTT